MNSNYLLNCSLCYNSYLAEFPDRMCPYCFPALEERKNLKDDYEFDRKLRRWVEKDENTQ